MDESGSTICDLSPSFVKTDVVVTAIWLPDLLLVNQILDPAMAIKKAIDAAAISNLKLFLFSIITGLILFSPIPSCAEISDHALSVSKL